MPKELSKLIEEINSKENRNDLNIQTFLIEFKEIITKEPEKIEEIIISYENLIKRSEICSSLTETRMIALQDIVGYCFLVDIDIHINFGVLPDMNRLVPAMNKLVPAYLRGKKYGPATKALSDFLDCNGETMIMKISKTYLSN